MTSQTNTRNDIPRRPIRWSTWLVNGVMVLICVLWVVPVVWAAIVSFRPKDDVLNTGDVWFGERITTESYSTAIDLAPFFPDVQNKNLSPDSFTPSNPPLFALQVMMALPLLFEHYGSGDAALLLIQIALVVALVYQHVQRGALSRGFIWGFIALMVLIQALVIIMPNLTGSYYANTIKFVGLTLFVQLFTVTMAGFAFAHYDFLGKKLFFYFVLLQMMIPTAILIVPNFVTIREFSTTDFFIPEWLFHKEFDLYDTPWAVAMPYFGSAFGTFLMRQAFLEVPSDLVDAGRIDGCRWNQLLWNIYLPPARPSLVAFGLVSVSFHWNELLWPLVVTTDKARPLTMGLLRFTQLTDIGAQWSLVMAATMIIIAPLMLGFLIFQRQFIQSFVHSGMK